jgi:signal recognition particle subunit SRP54
LLVLDATTGQNGISQAKHFTDAVSCTGIVLAKLDGTAKGGVVVAIRQSVGLPVKYVGVGEKPDAFEPFHPDRVAQRILGMGDMLSLIEKVEETYGQKEQEEMQRKLIEDEFSLGDFRDQMKQLRKLGPLESILGMMPQLGPLKDLKNAKIDEKEITRLVAIVDSMTTRERNNHMIINGARRRRIARGSGTSVQEVNNLLKQYAQMRKMMKSFTGGGFLGKKLGKLKLPMGFGS